MGQSRKRVLLSGDLKAHNPTLVHPSFDEKVLKIKRPIGGRPIVTDHIVLSDGRGRAFAEILGKSQVDSAHLAKRRDPDYRQLYSTKDLSLSEHIPTVRIVVTMFKGVHVDRKVLDAYEVEDLLACISSILYRKNESILRANARISGGKKPLLRKRMVELHLPARIVKKVMKNVKRYYDDRRYKAPSNFAPDVVRVKRSPRAEVGEAHGKSEDGERGYLRSKYPDLQLLREDDIS
jgi:hypothetical protein